MWCYMRLVLIINVKCFYGNNHLFKKTQINEFMNKIYIYQYYNINNNYDKQINTYLPNNNSNRLTIINS